MAELTRLMVEGKSDVVFADLFAPDGVMEYPFAIPGFPSTLDGREAIREFFKAREGIRETLEMAEVTAVVHETDDPEVVITEIEHHGMSHITNAPYQVRALGIIRVRDGEIVHYRDYMNPLALAELTGRLPDLINALG
jgi:ketosteroid isomerase-like protein